MALTSPQPMGLVHGALKPRGVYLSGPGEVFAVWTVYETGGTRFASGPHRGAEGTITTVPGNEVVDGEAFVLTHVDPVTHATSSVTFEFDNNLSVVESGILRAINFVGTETADEMRDLIIDAVNLAPDPDITASIGGPGLVSLRHNVPGRLGHYPITDTVTAQGFTHTGMTWPQVIMPVAPDIVREFDAAALTADRAVVVYDNGTRLKYFVYDFVADTLITDTTVLDTGLGPAMVNDGQLRTTYVKDNIVKMLTALSGDPLDLVDSPAYVIREQDVGQKQAYVIKYLATHSQSVDVALPIRAGGTSVLVHDYRDNPLALPSFTPQSVGVEAYWKMDDSAADTVVANEIGADGVLLGGNNTVDLAAAGKLGGALVFNGSSDVVDTGHQLSQNVEGSLSCWFRRDSSVNDVIPVGLYGGANDRLYLGVNYLGYIGVGVGASNYGVIYTDVSVVNGVWYLVVLTFDGSFFKAYVNGVLKGTWAQSSAPSLTTDLFIGANNNNGSPANWFPGAVDDVRVYGRALDQTVVDDMWNSGAGAVAPPPYPAGIWDYYFADKSGNDNTMKFLESDVQHLPGEGVQFGRNPLASINDWDVPAFFVTTEALFVPSGQESSGRMLDGELFMGYDAWGRVYWGYVDGGTVHKYLQTRLTGLNLRRLNHVAVTHQWGVAVSTRLYVNGLLVPGQWIEGTGATDPALGTITSTVDLGAGDLLVQLSVNDVIKSAADIGDYAKGRL